MVFHVFRLSDEDLAAHRFDRTTLWMPLGLMGFIYASTGPEEKKAAAFRQYT